MAKREARYYGIDNPTDVRHLEDSIRYRLFRLAIKPYERMRNKPLLDWVSLQVQPGVPKYPPWLQEHLDLFNGLIASEAKKYGFTCDTATEQVK
jgi:hypothetical protein